MPELITPTTALHRAWIEQRDEWGRGVHQDGAGLRPDDDVDSPAGFEAWVRKLAAEEDPSVAPVPGWVHCTYRWIVEDGRLAGAIALRHELNDFLLEAGGHIGYGIRPSARGRGLAVWALGAMLDVARDRGFDRVLVTCNVTNPASEAVIVRQGGVLEDVRETSLGTLKRFWITL
ncbi:GNAT family N-acetyltransferase [Actinoplanes rectilineatus]|uniref:GNAT family N-acetyltransferase n=1 Tax=Actinoplanes rectilineatus TaxID=113571 RepID=UPI0005F2AE77|nr:GNAT family N-acetyltransferase [Actinoplanes rectilineatus]